MKVIFELPGVKFLFLLFFYKNHQSWLSIIQNAIDKYTFKVKFKISKLLTIYTWCGTVAKQFWNYRTAKIVLGNTERERNGFLVELS